MNHLVSINVGLPKDVPWNGKTIRTSIWKSPVRGSVRAGRLNLEGDGQADLIGHGGENRAVLVYQLDSYRHWAEFLGRSDFTHGQFGENLTVEGLSDEEVCIGDRYRIGEAVFEVTQPRVTCYKVGARMNEPQMPALLVAHRRPGFYFRVIEEGVITAGDAIVKIAEGPERMSVAEVDQLLYTPRRTLDALQRVLRIPALSKGWRDSFRELGDSASVTKPEYQAAAPWEGYRALRVTSVTMESDDVRSFVLASPDGEPLPPALPGQYVALRISTTADAAPEIRTYSLSGSPTCGTYRICVKREPHGHISAYLHETVHVGDTLLVSAPRGEFIMAPGTSPVVLISAGVGVTPVLAMLHAAAQAPDGARPLWWLHSARDGMHHCLAKEAQTLVRAMKDGHSCIFYSRPGTGDVAGTQYDVAGRISGEYFARSNIPKNAEFYVCGPPAFIDGITQDLRAWAGQNVHVHHEFFGPVPSPRMPGGPAAGEKPHLPAGEPGTGPCVTFVRSGLRVP